MYLTLDAATAATAPPTVAAAPPPVAPPPSAAAPAPAPRVWTYRVTGPNRASITCGAEGGNTSQGSDAELPSSTTVEDPGFSGLTFASVSAQNSGSGTIS